MAPVHHDSMDHVLAASRAASVAYYAAFDAFRGSDTPEVFEEAMVSLEAAQLAEQDARQSDVLRIRTARAQCDHLLEQSPHEPEEWWAIVGLSVEMEGAAAELEGMWGEERGARCQDLFRAAEVKVKEGLLNADPWECPPIVARIFDNTGGADPAMGEQ